MEEFINGEIAKLEEDKRQFEINIQRIIGAILAYKITLAELQKKSSVAVGESEKSTDNE